MFYEKFQTLCNEKGVSKQKACIDAGLSGTAWIRWSKGSIPGSVSMHRLCKYFGVSVESMSDDDAEIVYVSDSVSARQEVFDRPEMKILFDAAKDAPSSAILESAGNAYGGSNPPAPTTHEKALDFQGFFHVLLAKNAPLLHALQR